MTDLERIEILLIKVSAEVQEIKEKMYFIEEKIWTQEYQNMKTRFDLIELIKGIDGGHKSDDEIIS